MSKEILVPVCPVDELPPGARKIIEYGKITIGVFNVDGHLYAVRNRCPHRAAPLCRGTVSGTMLPSLPGEYEWGMENQILRCPWHGWEFDIRSGESFIKPGRYKVATYPVAVTDSIIMVKMRAQQAVTVPE